MKELARVVVMSHLSDIQIEMNIPTMRETASNRLSFVKYIIFKLKGNLNQEIDPDVMFEEYFKDKKNHGN